MANQKSRSTPAINCKCTVCGAKAHAIPDSYHRRCSGNPDNSNSLPKGSRADSKLRGKWQRG